VSPAPPPASCTPAASCRQLQAPQLAAAAPLPPPAETYDRRTKQQKVEPAVELLEALNQRAMQQGAEL
jgi:hypothetical protein